MAIENVPTDPDILTNTFYGMPVLEFAPLVSGVFQPFQLLGNIDSSELAKELERVSMQRSQGGTRKTILEIVTKLDPQFNVNTFTWSAQTMQYMLGSSNLTPVVADAVAAITDERVTATSDEEDFLDLVNGSINSGSITVTCATVTDEQVGIGDGTSGDASGDFTLDFKVLIVGDVTSVTVTNGSTVTTYAAVGTGLAASGNEVEVIVGTGALSGDLQFHVGGVAVNVTGTIEATYTPSHTLTEGLGGGTDDYLMDRKNGRIQLHTEATKATGTQVVIFGQPVFVDYTYVRLAHNSLTPWTQSEFLGKARIKHLSSIGINIVWNVPSAQMILADDALAWNDEDFATGPLVLKLLDDGTATPFGTAQHYDRDEAGNSV